MTFKKRLEMALVITGVILFIWFSISFIQVVSQNSQPGVRPEYPSWNMFEMLEEG